MSKTSAFTWTLALLLCAGCGARHSKSPSSDAIAWQTSIYVDHPLVGQIWSSKERTFIDQKELARRIASVSPLLLGERHDHPDHHRIQAQIVSQLKPGALVGFEMLDEDDAKVLKNASDAQSLREVTDWDKSGWPSFELYKAIFEAIYTHGHTPRAIHPARRRLRALMMGPSSQSTSPASQPSVLSAGGQAALKTDIDRAHCGYATPPIVAAMMKAQEFKDRWMSEKLAAGEASLQRVVIAGNGHVRKDYGLPNHMPPTTQSVGILEVKIDQLSPDDYSPARYDYIWFTPRLDTLNPCDKYKRALEQMKKAYEKKRSKSR